MKLSKKLSTCSLAAGAAALGATSVANAALNIFDHRSAPLYPIVDYWVWDQTLMVMDVKTGDFQYVQDDLAGTISRYDQNGFLDNNPIPGSELTNDTVWFSHRDVLIDGKGGDVVTLETPTGAVGGNLSVWNDQVMAPSGTTHEWHWASQAGTNGQDGALPLPLDGASSGQVDGSLTYNDSSPTGYAGAVTHGFGGYGHGSGWRFFVEGPDGWSVTVPFKLEEPDGTHYGWVAFNHNADRNRVRSVYGWAYETTPGKPAQLTWELIGDADGDGDVDDIDIDMMGDAIRTGSADFATYDISTDGTTSGQDGVIDINDLDYLVRFWAQTSVGLGTEYGDFNLDGLVDVTDLTRLATFYGFGTTWAEGNANRNFDLVTDTTDLTILSTFFGFVAPDVIPEPMTLGLLALGASGVLARRSRTR